MILYKITDQDNKTIGNTVWGEGITHKAKGKGYNLCSDNLIHAYKDPKLAIVLNRHIHGGPSKPKLWKAKTFCKKVVNDGLKIGVKSLTTIREIPVPKVSINARIHFAILCALEVYKEKSFVKWANNWLSGKDRSKEAATNSAVNITYVAVNAAYTAACATYAAYTAACATYAAYAAAYAAADAAAHAANKNNKKIDFVKLLHEAIKAEEEYNDTI